MMFVYRLIWAVLGLIAPLLWAARARRGKEDVARRSERFGIATQPRPAGKLIWLHGASVGESLSLLVLIDEMRKAHGDWNFLVTTGTVTSAKLMAQRLPANAIHQFLPYDNPVWVTKFLDHWRPNGVLWCESELWPALLNGVKTRAIPAVLLNGRISAKSAAKWKMFPGFIRNLLGGFQLIAAQTPADAARFRDLVQGEVAELGNLKFVNARLPVDVAAKPDLENRTVWAIASTHAGEELIAADIHWVLKKQIPNLVTIIAPRHPARADEIVAAIGQRGVMARRSRNEKPDDIYLWDTLGEMGTLYDSVKVIAMGGSFVRIGGHNPIEPAQFGCAIICGPHMYNFSAVMDSFESAQAVRRVADPTELAAGLQDLWGNPRGSTALGHAAQKLCDIEAQSLPRLWNALAPWRGAVLNT